MSSFKEGDSIKFSFSFSDNIFLKAIISNYSLHKRSFLQQNSECSGSMNFTVAKKYCKIKIFCDMFVRNFYLCVNNLIMKSIVIYPDNPKQFSVIEAFLEEMKIRFKSQEDIIISEEIKQSVLEGIKDAEEGRLISSEEVRKKAEALCSK
ncbi:hypothetical protein DRF62_04275 [Chryseobacterium piscium]|uniref:Uncharacterized protein n=3 Tax=Chryseobacterium TaxID=59732 RepID=A0A3D9BRY6_9FLAO|nr:hypothetical protein DRF62_04275 [Chryseobacterium piscium]